MVYRVISIVLLICISQLSLLAQVKLQSMVAFDYSFGIATGGLNTYIPNRTFDGAHFHYKYFLKRNLSIGVSTGWNSFSTVLPRSVYETDRGTVSAVQTRYFHSFPLVINGFYYLRSLHYVMPYIGGGAGLYWLRYEKFYGVFSERDNDFEFGIRPELGIVVPFKNSGIGLILSGRYNTVIYSQYELNNLRYVEASIGLYFGYPVFDKSYYDGKL